MALSHSVHDSLRWLMMFPLKLWWAFATMLSWGKKKEKKTVEQKLASRRDFPVVLIGLLTEKKWCKLKFVIELSKSIFLIILVRWDINKEHYSKIKYCILVVIVY